MSQNPIFNKSCVTLLDFTPSEIDYLINLSQKLKSDKSTSKEQQYMKGKNIALIFEKSSTRTRCAFEVSCFDQGAHCTYLDSSSSQLGKKETVKDTARVLGRMYDGIEFRGFKTESVEILAKFSGCPVWNGLTDEYHPTQILATLLTIKENVKKPFKDCCFCFVGDGRFNMGISLMIGAAKMGIDYRFVGPKQLFTPEKIYKKCLEIAKETGAKIKMTDNIDDGVKGVDLIYTDVWVSMGEPAEVWDERIRILKPYCVTSEMMKKTGNPECFFTHCLPSFHNDQTIVGKKIKEKYGLDCMEVTDEVFESKKSVVFDESENRLHTIKALMVSSLNKEKII